MEVTPKTQDRYKWRGFTKRVISQVLNVYGVFEITDENKNVIYVGEGKLRDRLMAHLEGRGDPLVAVLGFYFRYERTGNKRRAKQIEKALLRLYLKPGKWPIRNDKL